MELSLGELMVRAGVVTREQRDRAAETQRRTGANLVASLVDGGAADEERIMAFVAERFGLEEVAPAPSDVDDAAIGLLPLPLLRKRHLLPLSRSGSVLEVAMSDPTDLAAVDEIRFMTGHDVRTVLARPSAIRAILEERPGAPVGGHGAAGCGSGPGRDPGRRPDGGLVRAGRGYPGGGPGGFPDEGCGGPGRQRHPHRAVRRDRAHPFQDRRGCCRRR